MGKKLVSYRGYNVTKKMRRLLFLYEKFSGKPYAELTQQEIEQLNSAKIPNNRLTRKMLNKSTGNIEETEFRIPVTTTDTIYSKLFTPKHSGKNSANPPKQRPLIIFFHGGGWVFGNKTMYDFYCRKVADTTKCSVLSVFYRLAPAYRFPTAIEDSWKALLWASKGAPYWNCDPNLLCVMGDSAGGNIAAVLAQRARASDSVTLAGQILLYPVTDGRMRTASYEKSIDAPILNKAAMEYFIRSYQSDPIDCINPEFSPLLAKDFTKLPPALIVTAEYDPLHDDGRLYAEALSAAGNQVTWLDCNHTTHGFINYPMADGSAETEEAICTFIKKLQENH